MHPLEPGRTYLIAGASGSGKSNWIYRALKNSDLLWPSSRPRSILYCFGIWQKLFETMSDEIPNITFHQGLPTEEQVLEFSDPNVHKLLVLDDLMTTGSSSEVVELIFVRISHHKFLSCLYVVQNAFVKGSKQTTIGLNSNYILIFRSPRSLMQLQYLNSQIFPEKRGFLTSAYKDALSLDKHGYLLIDNTPDCDDSLRVRTRIMPEETTFYYL